MVKFESLKVGDVLYDCSTYGVGNTTMRAMGCWTIEIVSLEPGFAMTRWNGNAPTTMSRDCFKQSTIRRWPPEWVSHPIEPRRCVVCHQQQLSGHANDCRHPKAVAARKKAINK